MGSHDVLWFGPRILSPCCVDQKEARVRPSRHSAALRDASMDTVEKSKHHYGYPILAIGLNVKLKHWLSVRFRELDHGIDTQWCQQKYSSCMMQL